MLDYEEHNIQASGIWCDRAKKDEIGLPVSGGKQGQICTRVPRDSLRCLSLTFSVRCKEINEHHSNEVTS
jgi:hypothetical protein